LTWRAHSAQGESTAGADSGRRRS